MTPSLRRHSRPPAVDRPAPKQTRRTAYSTTSSTTSHTHGEHTGRPPPGSFDATHHELKKTMISTTHYRHYCGYLDDIKSHYCIRSHPSQLSRGEKKPWAMDCLSRLCKFAHFRFSALHPHLAATPRLLPLPPPAPSREGSTPGK